MVFFSMERDVRLMLRDNGGGGGDGSGGGGDNGEGGAGKKQRGLGHLYTQWAQENSMNNKRLTAARKIAERIRSTLDSVASDSSSSSKGGGKSGVVSKAWEQAVEACVMHGDTALAEWVTECTNKLAPIIEACFEDHCYQRLPYRL
jgi:hypothetical protein